MAEILITSFFTRNGAPANDIETVTPGFPLVRIWEVVDGTAGGDAFIGQFIMSAMEDGANDDGFYKYEFATINGYDATKSYVIRTDGGSSLSSHEQFQTAQLAPQVSPDTIADAVWDEPKAEHLLVGSTGEALSQIKADTTDMLDKLYLDADSVLEVVQLLLKMEAGRTKIDPGTNTMTVFDEDCVTVLRTFQLLDSTGTPSVSEICERKPIVKGTNDNTTITDICP